MMPFYENIQFGLDLATSATIVGAAITWYRNDRKNREIERTLGLADATRATVVDVVNRQINEMSGRFSKIVELCISIERPVERAL
ncbi:MAG: hypothetical protein ACKO96_20505, partial [Flammeovirgaceae bacterium]